MAWEKYQRSEKREHQTAIKNLKTLQVAERRELREKHKLRKAVDSVEPDKAELAQRQHRALQHLEETYRNKQRAQSSTHSHSPHWIPNPPFGAWVLGDRRSLDYWRKFVKGLPDTEFVAWLKGTPDFYEHAGRIAFLKKRITQIQKSSKTELQDQLQTLENPRKPGPVPKAVDPQALADAKQLHQTLTMQFNAVEAPFGNAEKVDLGELCNQLLPNVTPEELREVVILPSDEVTTSRKTAMLVSKQTGIPIARIEAGRSPGIRKTSTKKPRRKRHVPFDENKQ